MKSIFALAALFTSVMAQRLSILEPSAGAKLTAGSTFTVELHEDESLSSIQQVSVVIAMNPCYDVCDSPSEWGPATVLYNGSFNPQFNSSYPQKGLYQDFTFTLEEGWPTGGNIISVAHLLDIGAISTLSFDYTNVLVNVTTQ